MLKSSYWKRERKMKHWDEELETFNLFVLRSLQISCITCDSYKT